LNRWFDAVAQYKQKISLNKGLSKLYPPKTPFFKLLETEKKETEQQFQKLTDTLNDSPLFAAKYMKFKMDQEEKLAKVWESNEERTKAKNYFTQIDFDSLYGTSLWFTIINSCIEAYVKEGIYYQTFGSDVVRNLKRIKNQQVYEDLIDATISVTEKFSWNIDQAVIVDFIIEDNRIKKPTLKLQKIIEAHNLTNGKKAPDLFITNPFEKTTVLKISEFKSKYTLLLFYQSDCGHCKTAIEGLKSNFKDLVQKGIKIISIACDNDKETFKITAPQFPWTDSYCDLNGMNGINFKNYAVIGTPTMYILDSKGIIFSKMATITEVLDFMKNK
jgi:thiol-disulfide isomerase/thioredoxin